MKGYRTLLFNIVAIATLAVTDYAELIPPRVLPYVAFGIAAANIVLRLNTSTPVGRKDNHGTPGTAKKTR